MKLDGTTDEVLAVVHYMTFISRKALSVHCITYSILISSCFELTVYGIISMTLYYGLISSS